MTALTLDLRPGSGLGSFTLGDGLFAISLEESSLPTNPFEISECMEGFYSQEWRLLHSPIYRFRADDDVYLTSVHLLDPFYCPNLSHLCTKFKATDFIWLPVVGLRRAFESLDLDILLLVGWRNATAYCNESSRIRKMNPSVATAGKIFDDIIADRKGMPMCEAIAHVEQHRSIFDVVQIKFHDEQPLRYDLVISFPEHGFHLRFEPQSQRLRLIEVFEVQRLQMRYATSSIGGPSIAATFVAVYGLFGPTFPGTYDTKCCIYTLFYPGLSFAFPIPAQYKECCQQREAELPLEFPDGTTPVMSRVCIYDSSVGAGVGVGASLKKAVLPQLVVGNLYMEEVHAKPAEELCFTGGRRLPFGASPQDVWAVLGRPDGIYQKQVDPMVIHSASDPRPRTALCGDYFYNYFSRGLDILFDGQHHRIKKFVLHTNFPGHTDFNCYIKCNFFIHSDNIEDADVGQNGDSPHRIITAHTKWPEVQEILGDGGRAAIQTQGSVSNPFGPTFVYGYRNIALEVMKNGHIATVTLFQTNPS